MKKNLVICMIAIAALVFYYNANKGKEKGVFMANNNEETAASKEAAEQKEAAVPAAAMPASDIIQYQEGFTRGPLTEEVKARITGISYQENPTIAYDDLQYLSIRYIDFEGTTKDGEMVCNIKIAQDLLEIFYELYKANYPIANISLIDEYGGNDDSSMEANNSSCFNYRTIAGSDKLSTHATGMAVDINPLFNPYVVESDNGTTVMPASAEPYIDRSQSFDGKIDTSDLCYQLFTAYGFTWGGSWNSRKDYQHFEKEIIEEY